MAAPRADSKPTQEQNSVGVINHKPKLLWARTRGTAKRNKDAAKDPDAAPYGEPVRIMPGFNRIPGATWAKIVDTHFIASRIKNRDLEVIQGEPVLQRMSNDQAIALISQTVDRSLLRSWADAEERRPVQEAIKAQLAKLDGSRPG